MSAFTKGEPPPRTIPGSAIITGLRRERAIREHLLWLKTCGADRFVRDYDSPIGRFAKSAARLRR